MLAVAVGCYNPKVTPGNLHCAAGSAKACPDGFVCAAGVCVRPGDGTGGAIAGTGGAGGGTGGSGSGGATCATPIPELCDDSPAAGTACDPVCQTGCGCGLRCSVSSSGLGCAPPAGAGALGDVCDPTMDRCSPGLFCLKEACGTNLGRCHRFCRDASACGPSGVCGTPVRLADGTTTDQRACNLSSDVTCDPFATGGASGCPDVALNCYVTGPSQTICDCPSGQNRQAGQTCVDANDCQTGLRCLQLGGSPAMCYRLCRNASDCAGCTILGSAGGYCP
jgi:hypothetical protein